LELLNLLTSTFIALFTVIHLAELRFDWWYKESQLLNNLGHCPRCFCCSSLASTLTIRILGFGNLYNFDNFWHINWALFTGSALAIQRPLFQAGGELPAFSDWLSEQVNVFNFAYFCGILHPFHFAD
jgi:hypothetical protein